MNKTVSWSPVEESAAIVEWLLFARCGFRFYLGWVSWNDTYSCRMLSLLADVWHWGHEDNRGFMILRIPREYVFSPLRMLFWDVLGWCFDKSVRVSFLSSYAYSFWWALPFQIVPKIGRKKPKPKWWWAKKNGVPSLPKDVDVCQCLYFGWIDLDTLAFRWRWIAIYLGKSLFWWWSTPIFFGSQRVVLTNGPFPALAGPNRRDNLDLTAGRCEVWQPAGVFFSRR